ncbi:MAG TPA: hypothetical protein VJW76_16375, partial [Verrucomicrobiae bacterium]|nr:hypothetical protein [Verrucomicrobiae bacterium]
IIVTNQKGGSTNNPIALERIHVVDDDGSVLEAVSDAITLNHPGEIIQGWRFKAFPRREKKVRCRFIYKDSSGNYATAAEMLIPNPTPGPHPVWTSAPAPLTSEDGDLKVTLLDFVAGLSREDEVEAKFRWYWIGRQTTRAVFKIEQPVRERLSWKLQSLSIADAAGNYWKPGLENPLGNTNGDGSLVAEFIGALWPSEPAWKLRAELSRTSNFTSDELCTLPDVAVPFTNQVVTLNTAHEVNGNTLHIVTVGGMGAELPDPYRSLASAKAVNLAVRMQPGAHRLSLVRVADGEGRLIPFSEPYPWFEDNRCFALEAAAGVGKLKITFAIHRSRFVEFTAKPKQVGKPSK